MKIGNCECFLKLLDCQLYKLQKQFSTRAVNVNLTFVKRLSLFVLILILQLKCPVILWIDTTGGESLDPGVQNVENHHTDVDPHQGNHQGGTENVEETQKDVPEPEVAVQMIIDISPGEMRAGRTPADDEMTQRNVGQTINSKRTVLGVVFSNKIAAKKDSASARSSGTTTTTVGDMTHLTT